MKFYLFHFMPYLHADLNFRSRGQNTLWMLHKHDFDPHKCAALYDRYLGELELADRVGFDGVCVNEHHQTPHSLMPAPNVIAAALTQRVRRGKILVLGRALPLGNPLSIAEEWAMLDNLSAGRLICGMVRGIGIEYHASGINPAESKGRFFEAHDLIVRAWTEPEAFEFQGKYYNYRYVNVFPRPFSTSSSAGVDAFGRQRRSYLVGSTAAAQVSVTAILQCSLRRGEAHAALLPKGGARRGLRG